MSLSRVNGNSDDSFIKDRLGALRNKDEDSPSFNRSCLI